MTASEILARPDYLNLPAELLERSLTGRLLISPRGEQRQVPGFLHFHDGAATFPWRSQAGWIASRLAARCGLDRAAAQKPARRVFRSDLYRAALAEICTEIPAASDKLEGALDTDTEVSARSGTLILRRDRFFDGQVFDPPLD